MKKIISALLISTFMVNITACGTILYPERKGQRASQIDPGVAILDGVGLFFFLIPGVIAYAVDFSNGTIYLPNGRHSAVEHLNINDMTAINIGKDNLSNENIQGFIQTKTGKNISFKNIEMYKVSANGEPVKLHLPTNKNNS